MREGYKILGEYIQPINIRNKDLSVSLLLGVSITKKLIPSIANTIGSNMANYKILERNQFAYGPVTSRNGEKISVGILEVADKALVSQSYTVFEVIDKKQLLPEYLMMWFSRPEFDRYARYQSHGSTRETFSWEEMCDVELPIPSIEKQREIVAEYQAVENKIKTNEQICEKLEAAAQALYRHWFVDFEFPNEEDMPYKSSGGAMVYNEELEKEVPEGWNYNKIKNIVNTQYGYTASASTNEIGPKLLRITDIVQSHIDWENVPYCKISKNIINRYKIKFGDILVARTGATAGFAKRIHKNFPKTVFASYLIRITPLNPSWSMFLGLSIDSVKFKQFIILNAQGSAQPQANANLLTSFKTILPTDSIINMFNNLIEPTLDLIESKQLENQKLNKLQKLLLTRMIKNIDSIN